MKPIRLPLLTYVIATTRLKICKIVKYIAVLNDIHITLSHIKFIFVHFDSNFVYKLHITIMLFYALLINIVYKIVAF